jgi:hypothetical protein
MYPNRRNHWHIYCSGSGYGSVVLDAKTNGVLGVPFIAFAPFVGVAIGSLSFWKSFDGSF